MSEAIFVPYLGELPTKTVRFSRLLLKIPQFSGLKRSDPCFLLYPSKREYVFFKQNKTPLHCLTPLRFVPARPIPGWRASSNRSTSSSWPCGSRHRCRRSLRRPMKGGGGLGGLFFGGSSFFGRGGGVENDWKSTLAFLVFVGKFIFQGFLLEFVFFKEWWGKIIPCLLLLDPRRRGKG